MSWYNAVGLILTALPVSNDDDIIFCSLICTYMAILMFIQGLLNKIPLSNYFSELLDLLVRWLDSFSMVAMWIVWTGFNILSNDRDISCRPFF